MDRATYIALVRQRNIEAMQRKQSRLGRRVDLQKTRLLDDADQNIGNAEIINPQLAPTNFPETNPPRILNLDALAKTGMMTTVSLSGSALVGNNAPIPGNSYGGPIIGIIEFGNGSVFTRVEVDVPIGPITTAGFVAATNLREPEDGVTILSVPTGTLRVYARNDANLLPTTVQGLTAGIPNGGANPSLQPSLDISLARSAFVKAQADYHQRAAWRAPTRTLTLFAQNPGLGSQFTVNSFPTSYFSIPPLSKRVRLLRNAGFGIPVPSVTIEFLSPYLQTLDQASVGVGATSPFIDVPGQATWFNVLTGAAVIHLAAQFEIGF